MGHLTAEERGVIEYALEKGTAISTIALELNRHPSTIYREIRRNSMKQGKQALYSAYPYRAQNAGNLAKIRRKRSRKPSKYTPRIEALITTYLDKKWSPEQIVNGLPRVNVSVKTIYNWIYSRLLDFSPKHLRRRGKTKRKYSRVSLVDRPDKEWFLTHSIDLRPEEVNNRSLFGHWEADSVVSGREGKGAVATFVERKTRKYVAYLLEQKNNTCMHQAMNQLLDDYPNCVHSITCDRGSEFIHSSSIEKIEQRSVEIYFAHAYSPQERGANENHNGLLREYFPKGHDFSKVSQEELTQATNAINERPRKVLSWKSANRAFRLESMRFTRYT